MQAYREVAKCIPLCWFLTCKLACCAAFNMLRRGGAVDNGPVVDLEGGGGGLPAPGASAPVASFAPPPSAAAASAYVGGKVPPINTLLQPMGAVLGGGLLLGFFAGEAGYLIIVLAICACGLIFAKYLSE